MRETYLGQPLVNKQHPHDLFMEVAALYTWQLDDANSVFFYAFIQARARAW